METTVDEIGPDIYRLSTCIPEADFMFNQFLIDAEEPLLFHTGLRSLFPLATCLTPATGVTIRSLATLQPTTLGVMHGPSYAGDCVQALHDLASAYDDRLATEGARLAVPHSPGPRQPH